MPTSWCCMWQTGRQTPQHPQSSTHFQQIILTHKYVVALFAFLVSVDLVPTSQFPDMLPIYIKHNNMSLTVLLRPIRMSPKAYGCTALSIATEFCSCQNSKLCEKSFKQLL